MQVRVEGDSKSRAVAESKRLHRVVSPGARGGPRALSALLPHGLPGGKTQVNQVRDEV